MSQHICHAEKNMKLDRNGIVGAVPEEDLHWKKAIACEGQKLYIECPIIYNRIQVQSTFYGRDDTVTCKHPQLPSSKICAEQNVTVKNVVMDLCQGVEKCEVSATNDFLAQFGTIICPNVYKYLYVKYRCVPKNALADAPGLSPYDHTASVTKVVNTNYAPVQCCYVVPGTSTSQTTTSVGGTIIRHNHGIQSVEERIVSEQPQGNSQSSLRVIHHIIIYTITTDTTIITRILATIIMTTTKMEPTSPQYTNCHHSSHGSQHHKENTVFLLSSQSNRDYSQPPSTVTDTKPSNTTRKNPPCPNYSTGRFKTSAEHDGRRGT